MFRKKRIDKQRKKHSWSTQGGHIAPIMVPSTPRGELADMLRKVVQTEANKDMKFKIIEKGGRTVMSLLQRSNPTATPPALMRHIKMPGFSKLQCKLITTWEIYLNRFKM